jgi:hypothetical protein
MCARLRSGVTERRGCHAYGCGKTSGKSFLKLTGIRDHGALNEASLKIDDAFLKLSNANADDFLKIESSGFLKFEFEKIGDSFIKLGDDFHKISVAGEMIDQTVLKLTGAPTVTSVDGGGERAR